MNSMIIAIALFIGYYVSSDPMLLIASGLFCIAGQIALKKFDIDSSRE